MQRRKHVQLDLRVSFIPCRARDYCEERYRYGKKRTGITSSLPEARSGAGKDLGSNAFLFWSFFRSPLTFIPWLSIKFILLRKKPDAKNFSIILASKKSTVWVFLFVFLSISLKAFMDVRNKMQRGVFYYKAQKEKITQAVVGTSRWHQCPSSRVVPGEEANAATASQHAVSTCCPQLAKRRKQRQCLRGSSSLHQWRRLRLLSSWSTPGPVRPTSLFV